MTHRIVMQLKLNLMFLTNYQKLKQFIKKKTKTKKNFDNSGIFSHQLVYSLTYMTRYGS